MRWRYRARHAAGSALAALALMHSAPAAEATLEPGAARTGETLVFEAELCPALAYPWQPVRMAGASGGLALTVPEGCGSDEAFESGRAGQAEFAIPAASPRVRRVWLRVYWNGNCSNSLYARSGPGRRWVTVASYTMRRWHWIQAEGLTVPATGGAVVLANREDGVWVDQLCIVPEGSPGPAGVMEATAAWPVPGPALPPVSMVPCPGGAAVEALPPTEYLLHHRREARLALPCEPVLPVFTGRATPLALWLRWNRASGLPADMVLEPPPGLAVEPGLQQTLRAATGPLECLSFSVRAQPELPRGYTRLACRLRTAEGLEQVREVRVLRPYRWLVSQAYRLNPEAGLDQLEALDAAVAAAPLAPAHGVTWQEARPDHFTVFGLLNLRQAVSPQPFVQAYAFARVPGDGGPATLDLTHDDWIRVWVNGACVYSSQESAPSTLTRARVEVTLRAGENDLLVRCAQQRNYWEFGIVVEPGSGAPPGPVPVALAEVAPPAVPTVSLPAWCLESIEEDLGGLMGEMPPGQGWRVVAAVCRQSPLTPVESWQRLVPRLQGWARGPEDLARFADSLLDLRRRAEATTDLATADRAALVAMTYRERATLLGAVQRPVEAAEETQGAIGWAPTPPAANPLHSEVVRLYLSAGALEEALAYLAGPAAGLPQARSLQGIAALYQGDVATAAPLLAGLAPDAAGRYAGWLLRAGRAPEAEWLLVRTEGLSPRDRLSLAVAYSDQRRFVEAGEVLWECLLRTDAQPYEWASAASAYAEFHAARCSIPAAVARVEGELACLPPQAEDRRLRLLDARVRLHEEAEDPVPLMVAAVDRADEAAQRYRQRSATLDEGRVARAMSRLSAEQRHEEMLRLCNRTLSVSPALGRVIDAWRLDALTSLGREGAAAAVLERLMAAAGDPRQARRLVGLLGLSRPTAPAASRLARVLLEKYPDDRALAVDAWLAIAYAGAVLGQYADTVAGIDHALALQDPATCSSENLAVLARSWVEHALAFAGRDPALGAALLAFSGAVTRQATAELLGPAGTGGLPWAKALVHGPSATDLDAEGPTGIDPAQWGDDALALFREIGSAGAGSRYVMEPGEPPHLWILAADGPPLCVSMGKPFRIERFPDAFRAWTAPAPTIRAIAFLEGLVWLGTDRGLYCYRRAWNCWDRLRWPGGGDDLPVAAVTGADGLLAATLVTPGGGETRRHFDLATWTWRALPE